jgi:HEAT repeat protein
VVSLVGVTWALLAVVVLLLACVLGVRTLREWRERRWIERKAAIVPAVRELLSAPQVTGEELAAFWRRTGQPEAVARLLLDEIRALPPSRRGLVRDAFELAGRVDRDIAALRDRRWWVRAAAAERLERLEVVRAADPLLACLADPHEEVRIVSARALAALGDNRVVRPLLASLAGASRWAAIRAAAILASLGPSAADTLVEVVREEAAREAGGDPRRLRLLLDSLAEIGDRESAAAVTPLLGHRSVDVRARVVRLVGRHGGAGTAALLRGALDDAAWPVRAQAAAAFLEAPVDEGALDALALRLSDSAFWVRANAAETLAFHPDPRARARLDAAMRSPDPFAREAAARVLDAARVAEARRAETPPLPRPPRLRPGRPREATA